MTEEQFQTLRAYIEAPALWQQANLRAPQYDTQGQPSGGQSLPNAYQRFDPRELVRIFRRCGWLNIDEMARCFPRRLLHPTRTQFVPHSTTWNIAHVCFIAWVLPSNQVMGEYGLPTPRQRLLHSFAYVIPETGNLHFVKEINGESKTYTPYYGRGLIQLMHLENYLPYGRFRKFPAAVTTSQLSGLGRNPDVFVACDNRGDHSAYGCADSACFYVAIRTGMLNHTDADVGQDNAIVVSKDVDGDAGIENLDGLDARLQAVLYLRNALLDDVFPDQMLPLAFEWGRNTQKEPVFDAQGDPVMVGNPPHRKRKFYPTQHTVLVSLELQRPQSFPVKKFIFAFTLVTLMVARTDISSEIMCFESGEIESVNFEIKTYYDASAKFSLGFVRYRDSKKTIPIVLNRSISETLDKNMPDQTTNTWTEVYGGKVTDEYEMISQGTGMPSIIYTRRQGSKKIAFFLSADTITLSGYQWQIFTLENQKN